MAMKVVVLLTICAVAAAQRPFYAGLKPIGFPDAAAPNPFSNRFGEDADQPILANRDGNLINRLNQLPVDKQPFWYLNWQKMATFVVLLAILTAAAAQRPFFAGSKPIGFPDIQPETPPPIQDLPLEARGDRELVERLKQLPVDKQPFWFLNWRQYEEQMKNPETYSLRPSIFNRQDP
ncbi:uncharacterized protein LOC121735652 [Aricia agestis]|uniref:uncharacterized protein LOC121735652 n=1 Tax=Aricia agestis TaxID=91739 RepID=UPI001C209087|nr:uncharacterized protein LOC121735652 [Aricia agestis]